MTSVTEPPDTKPTKERKRMSPPPPGFFLALGIMLGISFGLLIGNLFNGILAGALISGIIELRAFAKRQS
jgi:hypothetical protein